MTKQDDELRKEESNMSDFELNKSGYYTSQNVEEIEGFDKDDYGNTWYNVKFEGNAETMMWLAKNKPEEGKEYYGHIEKTKSGKRLRFKTDKKSDSEFKGHTKQESRETQDSISRSVALKAGVDFCASQEIIDPDEALKIADTFLAWLQDTGSPKVTPKPEAEQSPQPEPSGARGQAPTLENDEEWDNLTPPADLNSEEDTSRPWNELGK